MPMVGCQWFATIGGLGRQRLRVLMPRPVGWGGGAPGFWQYDRRREAAAGAAALVSRQWNPPPNAIRRICNKAIHFFEMSVLFETGELNAYVYDSGALYRRKYVCLLYTSPSPRD